MVILKKMFDLFISNNNDEKLVQDIGDDIIELSYVIEINLKKIYEIIGKLDK